MDIRKNLVTIRKAETADLERVLEIQLQGYDLNYRESRETFEQMIQVYPSGCIVAQDNKNIIGYLFSHPFYQGILQELNSLEIEVPKDPDCFYFHDLCVHSISHGLGIANLLIESGVKLALGEGLAKITCVAVNESHKFLQSHGFKIKKRLDYGKKLAYYMERDAILSEEK